MSAHDHRTIVPGCYRCDLSADELFEPVTAAEVEAAATRIHEIDFGTLESWGSFTAKHQERYRYIARAALEAARKAQP